MIRYKEIAFVAYPVTDMARARKFYDLERLWKSATRLTPADLLKKPAATKPAKRTATSRSAKAKSTAGPKATRTPRKKPSTRKKARK